MDKVRIEELKEGDLFRLKENGKLCCKAKYNRSTKKYDYFYWDDISHFGAKKKGTLVIKE